MSDPVSILAQLGSYLLAVGFLGASALLALPTLALLLRVLLQQPTVEWRSGGIARYPLAPMDTLNSAHSCFAMLILLALPVLGPAILLLAWACFRPRYFELRSDGLYIIWPLCSTAWIPAHMIFGAEFLDRQSFLNKYGQLTVGGSHFMGDFGSGVARVKFDVYVSRSADYVVVYRAHDKPLLITPVEPARFVDAVNRLHSGGAPFR